MSEIAPVMPLMVPFGLWLRQRRKAGGMTKQDLADRTGCSLATIEKIEAGNRRPSEQIAELLARLFEVPVDKREEFVLFARGGSSSFLPTNLPAHTTAFVGRGSEIETVRSILRHKNARLLTLVGAPGIGKTRLGVEAAAGMSGDFADGVFLVPLAPIRDSNLVVFAIAQTFGLKEEGYRPLTETLKSYLREKQLLLLLDNFEHLMDAALLVSDLLASAPRLKVLATSREALHLHGEKQFQVPPLSLPGSDLKLQADGDIDVETMLGYEAVKLFVERAADVRHAFTLDNENARFVGEICRRLDGLPLAIELAAPHIKTYSPKELLDKLEHRLTLLTDGARDLPPHQRTLRGAIEWSYDLLAEREKALFRRLGVFVGGCTEGAAAAVCKADSDLPGDVAEGLSLLASKNLIRQSRQGDGEPRYMMLETIREYTLEKLVETGEISELRQKHAQYYQTLAERAWQELRGPEQSMWLDRLERDHDNLRATLSWELESGHVELGLQLAGTLLRFWEVNGHYTEGREQLDSFIELSSAWSSMETFSSEGDKSMARARAKALQAAGWLAYRQSEFETALVQNQESLRISRKLGDKAGMSRALNGLAVVAGDQGEHAEARSLYEESLLLLRELGDKWGIAVTLNNLGFIALEEGNYVLARSLYEESLGMQRELGDDTSIAYLLNNLGDTMRGLGDYEKARSMYEQGLEKYQELGFSWGVANAHYGLGHVAKRQSDLTKAAKHFRDGLLIFQELGSKDGITWCLAGLAEVAGAQGNAEPAARLFGASEALSEAIAIELQRLDQVEYDQSLAEIQAQMDEAACEAFTAAWASGRGMTMERAVAYALEEAARE